MTGPEADRQQSVVTERLKRLFRHKSKISLRRAANVLRSSNQPPPSLIGTGVNRDSNLNVPLSDDHSMEPGMNSTARQRGELHFLSDMVHIKTEERSKTKESRKIGTRDIQRGNRQEELKN